MAPSRQAGFAPSVGRSVETIKDAALPNHLSRLLAALAALTLKVQVWKMKTMKNDEIAHARSETDTFEA